MIFSTAAAQANQTLGASLTSPGDKSFKSCPYHRWRADFWGGWGVLRTAALKSSAQVDPSQAAHRTHDVVFQIKPVSHDRRTEGQVGMPSWEEMFL